jgi:uncharacterized membrane protein YccC
MVEMATLYELTAEIQELEERLSMAEQKPDDWDQETWDTQIFSDLEEFLDTREQTEEELAKKIDAYVAVFRNYQARAQAQRAEGKHLYDMAKANENSMDRLKEAVKYASQQLGRSKLQGNTRSITVSETSKLAVDIVDANAIPDEFLHFYTECKIEKDAIAEHVMQTGEIVAGTEVRKITTVRFN